MDELTVTGNREVALQKFDKITSEIAEMESRLMLMKVQGPTDQEGTDMCHKGRMEAKKRRIEIVKWGEDLRSDAVKWTKTVTTKINPIESRIKKIEAHLQEQEDIIENENIRLKAEEDARQAAIIQKRIDRLCAFGCQFNGQAYALFNMVIPMAILKVCTDEQFEKFAQEIQRKVDTENKRKADEEADRKAEQERLAKDAAEQEAERQRLAKEKAEQEAAAQKIRDEQAAIEAEKKRIADAETARLKAIEDEKNRAENEKRRQAELEQARKEAAEKALKDAKEKAEREAAEKVEKERLAKIVAERKAARRPDKVKLIAFADTLESVPSPEMKTNEGKSILSEVNIELDRIIKTLRDKAEDL